MKLYAHLFSSYCQKVLTALYENAIPFELRMLTPGDQQAAAEHAALWPLKRMPVLVDGGRSVVETSIIIEHLDLLTPVGCGWFPRTQARRSTFGCWIDSSTIT